MIEVVPASIAHVGPIAHRMREADVIECRAFGRSPKGALRLGLQGSTLCLTAKLGGRPVAMFGVAPENLIANEGRPWFLGTDDVYRHGRAMLTHGPHILSAMSASFRRLSNYVSVDNGRAIRMLRAWGFTVDGDSRLIGGVLFHHFWRQA